MGTTLTTAEILNTGMQCLKEKLGVVEAERFISIIIREKFDYTKWHQEYFTGTVDETFNANAAQYAKEHPYSGKAKVIL